MARVKRYLIATQNGYLDGSYTKAEAKKVLAEVVRDSAARCRRKDGGGKRACAVIGTARKGSVEIRVGGRQGYHLWQRYIITADRS